MADLISVAKPYALAAFEYARDNKQLAEWKAFFAAAAITAKDPRVIKVATNPETPTTELYELFHGVLATLSNPERDNFLRLLAQNKRLLALPEIAERFAISCMQLEKISKVRVVTAIATLSKDFKEKITAALTQRIKHDVALEFEVDPSILGGAVIHIGDNVIDGSILGKLTRLLEFSLR